MKPIKTLLFVIFILFAGVFIQHAQAQSAGYGIRGGVNFSNLNNVDNTNSHTGLQLGLYFDQSVVGQLVMIQPEVLYTQKGFDVGDNTYRIDYVEVPVLARVNFVNGSGLLPYVYFGPYIGFKVNTNFPNSNDLPTDAVNQYIDDQINTTDFGVTVGAGLDFGGIDLGVRYDAGLTKVVDGTDAKNGVLSIVAGLGF